jgi:hypothetical protein
MVGRNHLGGGTVVIKSNDMMEPDAVPLGVNVAAVISSQEIGQFHGEDLPVENGTHIPLVAVRAYNSGFFNTAPVSALVTCAAYRARYP